MIKIYMASFVHTSYEILHFSYFILVQFLLWWLTDHLVFKHNQIPTLLSRHNATSSLSCVEIPSKNMNKNLIQINPI